MKFFVACAKGLEYLLVDELLAMGATRATAATAGANVEGVDALAYRAAMFSRLASRVLWPLAEFDCENEADLYQGVHEIDWSGSSVQCTTTRSICPAVRWSSRSS